MATGAVPVRIRTATHFSSENSHRETLHRGRMSRPPWAFVRFTTALRYESCTQFINVSQRTLHIYFIDGCRRIKIERNNLLCEQAPTEVFRSIFAWLVTLKLVWCKNSRNNEFRTKKFPNPEFLYGISSFCTLSENNSFLHGKISCFCIFLEKNSVFNTNRTPRVTLHQLRLAACSR